MLSSAQRSTDASLSEGEKRLVSMIIVTALKDARNGKPKLKAEAEKWLHSNTCYLYLDVLLDITPEMWEWILREKRKEIEARLKRLYNR